MDLFEAPPETRYVALVTNRDLPAAELIHFEGRSRARYIPPANIRLLQALLRRADEALADAVHAHLMTDVPYGVLLSGGLDSATVLAIARSEKRECIALSFAYGQRHSRELESVTDLSRSDKVNPYFLRVKNLFVEAKDLGLKGLDLKVGQQVAGNLQFG